MLEDAILDVIHRNGVQTSCTPDGGGWRIEATFPEINEHVTVRGDNLQQAAIRMAIALDIDVEE
jgi:hypothetical protein